MWAGAGHPSVVPVKFDALSNLDHLLLPSQQYIFGLVRTPAFVVVQTCWAMVVYFKASSPHCQALSWTVPGSLPGYRAAVS